MASMRDDQDPRSVLILMTSGPSTPGRCAAPFFLGAVLASMDVDVTLFLTMEAVLLAEKSVAAKTVAVEGGKPVLDFIRQAKEAGVKLYVCVSALPGYEVDHTQDLVEEVDVLCGGGVLADLVLSCDKVLTF
jgi:predicted peroxiredoxin